MRNLIIAILLIHFTLVASAQVNTSNQRLKVFIDCSNTFCDTWFIRTEINIVDFMLDRLAAGVHVLITERETGGGGGQYQLIFFGQNQFAQMVDTLRFTADPNATDFEERDLLVKHLKLGLTPYLVKAGSIKDIVIDMKQKETDKKEAAQSSTDPTHDPWNYWVLRTGLNGYIESDAVYKSSRLSVNFTASRVTEELKTAVEVYVGKNQTHFTLDDINGNKEKIINKNSDYSIEHYLIKSISGNWSWGYETIFSRSTFSNNKSRLLFRTGIEYAIFPYKEVNTKYFTVSYLIGARRNAYFESTLYDKLNETLWSHGIETDLSFNQKWGLISFGAEYQNYLHNWKYFNLNVNTEVDIRITGGLSFNIYTSASLTRDQLFLPKEGATEQEVLTRRRQLASGYNFYTSFGISYRFGSKLNNFVNPRFN